MLLPQDGDLTQDQWTGIGFWAISADQRQLGFMISGRLSGGYSGTPMDADLPPLDREPLPEQDDHAQSSEPIDLVSGDYLYNHVDLTVGSQPFPLGLALKRSYNSSSGDVDGVMGRGWRHNFDLSLSVSSDGFRGLGSEAPLDALAALVAQSVTMDIFTDGVGKKQLMVAAIVLRWYMDQLTNDTAGRLKMVTFPENRRVTYSYDDNSNLITLGYPGGGMVTYFYDQLNRVTRVVEGPLKGNHTILAHYEYDPLSRRQLLTYRNGTAASYTYEPDDDLKTLSHTFSSGSSVIWTSGYNLIGNRLVSHASDERFQYLPQPAAANTTYAPNPLNQCSKVNSVNFRYNRNGNLTDDGVNTYDYDSENRLTAVTTSDQTVSYTYDALGRRSTTTVEGVTPQVVYHGDQVLMEFDGSGQLLRRYISSSAIIPTM